MRRSREFDEFGSATDPLSETVVPPLDEDIDGEVDPYEAGAVVGATGTMATALVDGPASSEAAAEAGGVSQSEVTEFSGGLPGEGAVFVDSSAEADVVTRKRFETLYFALRNPKVVVAGLIVLFMLLLGIFGPMFLQYGPNERIPGATMIPPGAAHWFGTTMQGQDVFTQFVIGLRSTFLVGLLGGGIAGILGMVIGFVAGYRGGIIDDLLNMLTNIVLTIPAFVVLIIINAYLGVRSVTMQALFIGLSSWPWVARAVRSQTLSLRARDYIDLARTSGLRTGAIIRREIAPNMYSYLFMTFVLLFGGAVLTAASLDFIGLGPTGRDAMSLGLMMNQAVQWSALTLNLWWWFLVPGLGITLIVGSLYVMNVGLDEVFNPKLREM